MVSPLDRKLRRDLWRMKGQAAAIGLVIGLGVFMQVMMGGLVNTLEQTRIAYYDRYRFADAYAPAARAPDHVLDRLAAIPGVAAVEGRVAGNVLIDPGTDELPVRARALSLPDTGRPRLNDLFLTDGRFPTPGQADEALLLQGYAAARGLGLGDTLIATMNGKQRGFRIVGLAQSPEFLYTTAPGELVPDDRRFAILWLPKSTLAAAFDMSGAFNEALIALGRGTRYEAVEPALDALLAPYGGTGAYSVDDQISNRFVRQEIDGLIVSAAAVPPVFLAVAAFLLYIVISRMVQAEREQIGLLKAFGYSSAEISLHYLKFVLVIALTGSVLGALGGIAAGQSMAEFYQLYFKFPFLVFSLDPASFVIGFLASILAASAGSMVVLARVFSLTPAVAMRPPAPADYSRADRFLATLRARLDQPARMVLRRLVRYPGRMAGAVLGIATGMALSVSTLTMMNGFDHTVDLTFSVIDRSDMSVAFVAPLSDRTIYELGQIEGVFHVEPLRVVPAVLRHGLYTYRGAVEGRVANPMLNRVIGADNRAVTIRKDGIVLGSALAQILSITPGDTLTVEVREGRRPVLHLPVVAIAETLMGAPAFMEINVLNRALHEPGRISGAYMTIDSAQGSAIFDAIKHMPAVAGAALKLDARDSLVELMNTGPGAVRYVMLLVAVVITFGIVYNAARIAFAERSRDLASLRVMGLTRAEVAFVLLGELAVVTLMALPLGIAMGYYLTFLLVKGFSTDIYQIPVIFAPQSYGAAALAVLLAAAISGWLVRRDIDRIDVVETLKTRE